MTYHADKVSDIRVDTLGRYAVIRAHVDDGYDCVQCYQAGELAGSSRVENHAVEFVVSVPGSHEPIFLLAVDAEDAATNYWTSAFPDAATYGNRIHVSVETDDTYGLGYSWRITLDGTVVCEAV